MIFFPGISRRYVTSLVEGGFYNFKRRFFIGRYDSVTVDFSDLPVDPFGAVVRAPGCMIKVSIGVDKLRSLNLMAFPCGAGTHHPFSITAKKILAGSCQHYGDSPLRDYYDSCQPYYAGQFLGLESVSSPRVSRMEARYVTFPWDKSFGEKINKKRNKNSFIESSASGFDVPVNGGWLAVGPVSLEKGKFEFHRIYKLISSLEREGYSEKMCGSDSLSGCLLITDTDYAIVVSSGEHRAACLNVIGVEQVPIVIKKIVHRTSVETWPAVLSNDLTVCESLQIFDRVLIGKQQKYFDPLSYC
ncbi:hypothetical protein [Halomonas salinarum]|uniref:hypothetical protein n=1 Tax=Halomonas salinarum TaxID=1158993 RepID=UPI001438BC03|nr:hypothetical protein [Halomonas salinarum]